MTSALKRVVESLAAVDNRFDPEQSPTSIPWESLDEKTIALLKLQLSIRHPRNTFVKFRSSLHGVMRSAHRLGLIERDKLNAILNA